MYQKTKPLLNVFYADMYGVGNDDGDVVVACPLFIHWNIIITLRLLFTIIIFHLFVLWKRI